ncbi:MAG: hypothetical protein LBE25_09345 [Arthrobacter sp.]|nr:hypothetical protein [Arthrobacter sp.]
MNILSTAQRGAHSCTVSNAATAAAHFQGEASREPIGAAAVLSLAKFSNIAGVDQRVIRAGQASGVIPRLDLFTVVDLISRPVLRNLTMGGHPVPVLRAVAATPDTTSDPRPYRGFKMGASMADTLAAVDRWWTPPGRDSIMRAGGFLVASGTVIVAVVYVSGYIEDAGQLHYEAKLAGVLREGDNVEHDGDAPADWRDLADAVIGKRVLGGQGGNFTRL